MSVEIRYIDDQLVCDYGTIANTRVTNVMWGQALDVGPLILLDLTMINSTAPYGVTVTVDDALEFVRLEARNGSWIWRLEPAHQWDGPWPPDGRNSDLLYLGRWPD